MTVKDIAETLGLEVLTAPEQLARDITGGCVSDLLSQVMGTAAEGNVWITIQVHPNVVGVASLLELAAVIIAQGQLPENDTLAKAHEQHLPVLTSKETAFTIAGRLYEIGVR